MTVRYCLAGALFIMTLASGVQADVTQADIDRMIKKETLRHPYLYFSEADKPAMKERIAADKAFYDMTAKLLAEANRYLYMPVDLNPPKLPLDRAFDNTWEFEDYILNNTEASYTCAFAFQLTGDERYARKSFEFSDAVCNLPTWVHGYHEFPAFYDRVWPWGASDNQVVFSYAQWSDHIVLRIAAVYDWLYPALDKRQRDRIRGALLEKAITRVRGNYEYHWWATAYRCNWCTVCNGSLGLAALVLLTEDPHLTDVVAESWNRIGRTFDQIGDGGWQEGLGYMWYTIDAAMPFADALKRVTGGDCNLYEHPRLKDAMRTFLYCHVLPEKSVYFGDSGGGIVGTYTFYNTLFTETGNPLAGWLRDNLTSGSPSDISDLFRAKKSAAYELPSEASVHFRSVDWVVMRSDFTDPEKVVVFGKSGKNDDPHHGHLDVGHFCLFWRGKEFICDNGSAVQDKTYFHKERWDYPQASSIGHNVVLVNSELQRAGKLKNTPWDETAGGKVIEFSTGAGRDYALLDPTNAYPRKELKSWRRHLTLDKPVTTVVLDEVVSAPGAEVEVRYHSKAQAVLEKDYALLKADEGTMALIPVVESEFLLRPGRHTILPVDKNSRLKWIPYFGVVFEAKQQTSVIGTVIVPVKDGAQAEEIARSARISRDDAGYVTLSFAADGKTFTYEFAKGSEGLALKR